MTLQRPGRPLDGAAMSDIPRELTEDALKAISSRWRKRTSRAARTINLLLDHAAVTAYQLAITEGALEMAQEELADRPEAPT